MILLVIDYVGGGVIEWFRDIFYGGGVFVIDYFRGVGFDVVFFYIVFFFVVRVFCDLIVG